MSVGSTSALSAPDSFETLVNAISGSSADQFVIVVHGHEDGSGLFLHLANRNNQPVGARTTHDKLHRLSTIAGRSPVRIDPEDRQLLALRDAEIERLLTLRQTLRDKNIKAIEFRGCNLGRDIRSVERFKDFFGAASFGAPNLHSFFGRNPTATGSGIMGSHASSHQGTTFTYSQTFSGKTCHCCIGVNAERKPRNGHVVAEDDGTLNAWIERNFQSGASRGQGSDLPIHGLWEIPQIDLDNPDIFANTDPRPIFPLQTNSRGDNEYQAHVIYSP